MPEWIRSATSYLASNEYFQGTAIKIDIPLPPCDLPLRLKGHMSPAVCLARTLQASSFVTESARRRVDRHTSR